jgi:hypothetical protein
VCREPFQNGIPPIKIILIDQRGKGSLSTPCSF